MEVLELEVRPGGKIEFVYRDAASLRQPTRQDKADPDERSFSWSALGDFLEVDTHHRLAFRQSLDFGPRSAPQEYLMEAEFRAHGGATLLQLVAAATPSSHWTLLGRTNLGGQLSRLARVGSNTGSAQV